jgi:hypothetical protein
MGTITENYLKKKGIYYIDNAAFCGYKLTNACDSRHISMLLHDGVLYVYVDEKLFCYLRNKKDFQDFYRLVMGDKL